MGVKSSVLPNCDWDEWQFWIEIFYNRVVAEVKAVKDNIFRFGLLTSGLHAKADGASDASRRFWHLEYDIAVQLPIHPIQIIFSALRSASPRKRRMLVPDVQSGIVFYVQVAIDAKLQRLTFFVFVI